MKRTKNPVIWFQYFCWCVQFWMSCHKPYYPDWFRVIILKHWPEARERWSLTWNEIEFWNRDRHKIIYKPLPWFLGRAALGPLIKPWDKVASFFRGFTGGRSHRCEFTDKDHGALWGHNEGPFMDGYFEQFIKNISEEI